MTQEITTYTERELTWDEQVEHVITQLTLGRSIHSILREDDGMPKPSTFWPRLYRDEELYAQISRARQFGVEAILEQALDVASTAMIAQEITTEMGPDGTKRRIVEKDALGHRRLMVETMVRRAQMIQPRKYGAKLDLTSDGEKLSSIADAIAEGNRRIEESRKG